MSRKEILAKCISCHPSEYANEKIGPHSDSYIALLHHRDFVNDPKYTEKPYTDLVNKVMGVECVTCHAPDNFFETTFKGLEFVKDMNNYVVDSYSDLFSRPLARKDTSTLISGIDCISCHYNSTSVVTGSGFVEKAENREVKDYCFPIASEFLSSNIFCASCHEDAYKDMKKNLESGLTSQEQSCNNCHQEFKNGKGTHYYYWRHDPDYKKNENYSNALFAGLKATPSNKTIHLEWRNTAIPHLFNECQEIIATIEAIDVHNRIISADTIRLNRKSFHDDRMTSAFGNYILPGKQGHIFYPADSAIQKSIILPDNTIRPLKLRVSTINKAQYWFPDSAGVFEVRKVILLD